MKIIAVITLALVACVAAGPIDEPKVIKETFEQQPDGNYMFNFELDDKTFREEAGELKQVPDEENKPRSVIIVRGSYSYLNGEGKQETIQYLADETGYHADGPAVPKAPARR